MLRVATEGLQRSWLGQLVGRWPETCLCQRTILPHFWGLHWTSFLSPLPTHMWSLFLTCSCTLTHTEAKDTDPYIHKWLIHTQAQHVPQLHSCDQLNPNWLSRTEYLTFRPQNLKNPGPGTQGRVSESKGQKVQVVSGSGFVPGGTTWPACQPVSWASWFCTFSVYSWVALGMSHRFRVIPQGSWPPHTAPTHPEFRMSHTLDFKDSEWERAHWFFVMLATEMACLEMYWIK